MFGPREMSSDGRMCVRYVPDPDDLDTMGVLEVDIGTTEECKHV